jgi:hypothetical protein
VDEADLGDLGAATEGAKGSGGRSGGRLRVHLLSRSSLSIKVIFYLVVL